MRAYVINVYTGQVFFCHFYSTDFLYLHASQYLDMYIYAYVNTMDPGGSSTIQARGMGCNGGQSLLWLLVYDGDWRGLSMRKRKI